MYSAEQSGWGHSTTHGPGAASQWVEASKWSGPQRLQREDTVADKDGAPARRLPIDGTRQGCWADQLNEKEPEGGERAESQSILRTVRLSERPVPSSTGHNFSSRSK